MREKKEKLKKEMRIISTFYKNLDLKDKSVVLYCTFAAYTVVILFS